MSNKRHSSWCRREHGWGLKTLPMTGYKYSTVVVSQHRAWSPAAPGAAPTAQRKLDPEGLLRDDVATECLGPPSRVGAGGDRILACRRCGLVEELPHQGMGLQEQVSRLWSISKGEEIRINTEAWQRRMVKVKG